MTRFRDQPDAALRAFALGFLISAIVSILQGCVAGNKAEANLIKVEKQSTAKEFDQYATTTGRILRFIGVIPDAE